MIGLIIIGLTIISTVILISITAYKIFEMYFKSKQESNNTLSGIVIQSMVELKKIVAITHPIEPDLNDKFKKDLKRIEANLLNVSEMENDIKDLKSKSATYNVAKAFTPRRKS